MAARGWCQPVTVATFHVFSNFSAYSVLRFCGPKTKVKNFNTEDAEKDEGHEEFQLSRGYRGLAGGRTELFEWLGVEYRQD
jgi:hypothetical protein